jgi:L,D-peptidoglycan transpeptidase YkuD (ErfK/YbiS/YcfS/YnhG family)
VADHDVGGNLGVGHRGDVVVGGPCCQTPGVHLARILAPALVVSGVVGVVGAGTLGDLDEGAAAVRPAERDVQWLAGDACDLTTVEALGSRHPEVRQFVVLATDSFGDTYGSAFVAVRRASGGWGCQTVTSAARFGRAGTRPLLERRSGDGTTPAGVFPLAEVTAWDGELFNVFGNQPDPGVGQGIGYRDVDPQDCWGAQPYHPDYQHLVARQGCWGPDEWLPRFGDVYSHAAVIGANLDPISGDEPGETPYAAAIFLHRNSYFASGATKPTSGCVSLAYDDLTATLRLFDPNLTPHFAIGPTDWLRSTA